MNIDFVFDNALNMNDDEAVDYIFEQLEDEYNDDEIIDMLTKHLSTKKMQVGSGISSTLGWAKRKDYSVVVENPYK